MSGNSEKKLVEYLVLFNLLSKTHSIYYMSFQPEHFEALAMVKQISVFSIWLLSLYMYYYLN